MRCWLNFAQFCNFFLQQCIFFFFPINEIFYFVVKLRERERERERDRTRTSHKEYFSFFIGKKASVSPLLMLLLLLPLSSHLSFFDISRERRRKVHINNINRHQRRWLVSDTTTSGEETRSLFQPPNGPRWQFAYRKRKRKRRRKNKKNFVPFSHSLSLSAFRIH